MSMTDSPHQVLLLETSKRNDFPVPSPIISQEARSQAQEAGMDIAFGSVAGMVGKIIEYPFDTVKVRLQSSSRYSGPLDCFRQSFRSEGIGGLYRGISAPLFGAAVENGSLFLSYRLAQETVEATIFKGKSKDDPLPLSALMFCGAASGAFTSMLLTPIELVKCQMQVPHDASSSSAGSSTIHRGPIGVIGSIYRYGGIAGFWRGQVGTLIRETGGSAAWFGSYEAVKALFKTRALAAQGSSTSSTTQSQPIWQQMVAGACAGMAYNGVCYPADTIKSRMQTEQYEGRRSGPKVTFMDVGRAILKEQGIKGLYRGCGITVARSAPSSAFVFTIYETLRTWFG